MNPQFTNTGRPWWNFPWNHPLAIWSCWRALGAYILSNKAITVVVLVTDGLKRKLLFYLGLQLTFLTVHFLLLPFPLRKHKIVFELVLFSFYSKLLKSAQKTLCSVKETYIIKIETPSFHNKINIIYNNYIQMYVS